VFHELCFEEEFPGASPTTRTAFSAPSQAASFDAAMSSSSCVGGRLGLDSCAWQANVAAKLPASSNRAQPTCDRRCVADIFPPLRFSVLKAREVYAAEVDLFVNLLTKAGSYTIV
jgi:hypothetical protein